MKKNPLKKLVLSKETIRFLEEQALGKAAGGSLTTSVGSACNSVAFTLCPDSWCVCN
ncbi:MAG: class I lanthipeptide [Acidobacteriota bacterium]